MRRREFIRLFTNTVVAWPLTARAQQPPRKMRRLGVLLPCNYRVGEKPDEFPSPHGIYSPGREPPSSLIRFSSESYAPQCIRAGRSMSALGQKRTFTQVRPMSALPPKADIG